MALGVNVDGLQFYNPGQEGITDKLKRAVQNATAFLNRTIGITSGYRSPTYNAGIGGATGSYHTTGNAVDIDLSGMTISQRSQLVKNLIDQGVGGLITYSNSPDMLHADMRPQTGGKAWFMHDRTNAKLGNAPSWFQQLKDYVSGSGGGNSMQVGSFSMPEPITGTGGNPIPQIYVPGPGSDVNFGNDYTGPSMGDMETTTNEQYDAGHDHTQRDGSEQGGDLGIGGGPFGIDLGWLTNAAMIVLFVILGLVFLAAGLFLLTKGETTLKVEMPT